MFVIIFLLVTLLLASLALHLIWQALRYGFRKSWPVLLSALTLSCFVYLYGAWIYLTAYGKYAFALLAGITTGGALFRHRHSDKIHVMPKTARHLLLSGIFLALNILYFTGTAGYTEYAQLAFPMQRGKYFVLQGGKGLPANVAHFSSRRAVYAMDIVKLDRWGRRCSKIFSKSLADYFIFGDTVYSPCDGIIERAIGSNPDNVPPHRERGPHNLNGVVIDGAAYTVFLGHMQQGKVFVSAGQHVVLGQALGLAGNSGMSIEPHLHIQAHKKATDGRMWYEMPQLFILFDEQEYLLFEEIDARRSN